MYVCIYTYIYIYIYIGFSALVIATAIPCDVRHMTLYMLCHDHDSENATPCQNPPPLARSSLDTSQMNQA